MVENTNKDVNMTYETLFELLRREKNRAELQAMEPSFYRDFIDYLKAKKEALQEKQAACIEADELTKLMIQVDNINKIMKELYDRREKKIVTSALLSAKSTQHLSKEALLDSESKFYEELVGLLVKYMKSILTNLLNQRLPAIDDLKPSLSEFTQSEPEIKKPEPDTRLVRFLAYVPKFIGEQLEPYGPYEADEITTLPSKMAKILIDNNKAEEIQED